MLKSLKRIFVLIPCMIFAFFLFSGVKTLAADAVLLDSNSITIGQDNKENTYDFSNNKAWEFKAQYSALKDWDTFLKWRVVNPEGKATEWSDKDYYVDNEGKFIIRDYRKLRYTVDLGLTDRSSVAPKMTYYVDIEYYGQLVFSWKQDKDETLKIIVSSDNDSANTPILDVDYNSTSKKFTVDAKFTSEGDGVITEMKYFFSDSKQASAISSKDTFYSLHDSSVNKGVVDITPSNEIDGKTISVPSSVSGGYLYVFVITGNGYYSIVEYDMSQSGGNNTNPGSGSTTPGTGDSDKDTEKDNGLADYGIGQIILIVLVIVLIVSCALIITQKIVDYKKRLY